MQVARFAIHQAILGQRLPRAAVGGTTWIRGFYGVGRLPNPTKPPLSPHEQVVAYGRISLSS